MEAVNQSVLNLVNEKYTQAQKLKANETMKNEDVYLANYETLAIGVEDIVEDMSPSEIEAFYEVALENNLIMPVDIVISQVITALERETGQPIQVEYETAIVLSNEFPEIDYLANKVAEHIDGSGPIDRVESYELSKEELANDKLWENEDEDLDLMKETHERIVAHYEGLGVEFYHDFDRVNGEQLVYLGETQEQFQEFLDEGEASMPGNSRALISEIERLFVD